MSATILTELMDGSVAVTRQSPHTGQMNTTALPVNYDKISRYFRGDFSGVVIQQVFPELNDDQREFLMTGYTPEDWAAMFPPEDEESISS